MDYRPRKLAVFDKVKRDTATTPMPKEQRKYLLSYSKKENPHLIPLEGLGYHSDAVLIPQGTSVTYHYEASSSGEIEVVLAFVPRHPVNTKSLRFSLSVNGATPKEFDYATKGRSEEWKENVLWNRAHRIVTVSLDPSRSIQSFTITALDEGVILDAVYVKEKE